MLETTNVSRGQRLVQSEDEGVSIGVLLAPKAKHQTILKKFCSVPVFDDHLHVLKYNIEHKQTFQLIFVLSRNKAEGNFIVSPKIQLLKICFFSLSPTFRRQYNNSKLINNSYKALFSNQLTTLYKHLITKTTLTYI